MIDLIYPSRVAETLKGAEGGKAAEMLPVVETSGIVVAQASRNYCHSGSMVLHPVVHLHILNRRGELYIQHRSATKKLYPLRWDTAVGGHVSYGEQILEALARESAEELRLFDFNPVSIGSYVNESGVERELVNVFAAVGDFNPAPDADEVCEGRYWTIGEIEKTLGKEIFTPNFEYEFKRIKDKLLALL